MAQEGRQAHAPVEQNHRPRDNSSSLQLSDSQQRYLKIFLEERQSLQQVVLRKQGIHK